VVVKTPTTKEGLKATKCLVADGIKVNMTLCFSASQALLVAKAGGTYVSPFLGRLDDISHVGMDLIRDIVTTVPSAWPIIEAINNHILNGELYQALKETRKLVAYEKELLDQLKDMENKHAVGTAA